MPTKGFEKHIPRHEVITVPEAGWAGTTNGQLLRVAAGNVDAFVTIDKNMVQQQSLESLSFVVVVLVARTNRISDLLPLVPSILAALDPSKIGQVVRVSG